MSRSIRGINPSLTLPLRRGEDDCANSLIIGLSWYFPPLQGGTKGEQIKKERGEKWKK
jgi:hypothetical protein